MALKCGIVGLPNVGKSTLFNCLSNAKAQAANFPFCTIDPNVETVDAKMKRYEKPAKTGIDKEAVKIYQSLNKVKQVLEAGRSARSAGLDDTERPHVADLYLLTDKPVLYVCNVEEASAQSGN